MYNLRSCCFFLLNSSVFVEAWHDLELHDRVVRDQRTPGECRRRAFKTVPGGGIRDIEGKKTTFKMKNVYFKYTFIHKAMF